MMLCVLSSCGMCVCLTLVTIINALLYQGFSAERVIFLDIFQVAQNQK